MDNFFSHKLLSMDKILGHTRTSCTTISLINDLFGEASPPSAARSGESTASPNITIARNAIIMAVTAG